jgi:hypothetical protein
VTTTHSSKTWKNSFAQVFNPRTSDHALENTSSLPLWKFYIISQIKTQQRQQSFTKWTEKSKELMGLKGIKHKVDGRLPDILLHINTPQGSCNKAQRRDDTKRGGQGQKHNLPSESILLSQDLVH